MSKIVKSGYTIDPDEKVEILDVPAKSERSRPARKSTGKKSASAAQGGEDEQEQQERSAEPQPPKPPDFRDTPEYLVMMNKAKEEADRMAQSIIMGAIRQKDQMIQDASQEALTIEREAYERGLQNGVADSKERIERTLKKVSTLLSTLSSRVDSFIAAYESDIANLSLDIAGKIMVRRIEENPLVMVPLIRQTIASVEVAGEITLSISQKLDELYDLLKNELPSYVTISMLDASVGTSRAETATEAVDASIETQIENLREKLRRE